MEGRRERMLNEAKGELTDGSVGVEESLGDTESETSVTSSDDDDLDGHEEGSR
jgi:hypothetical protein